MAAIVLTIRMLKPLGKRRALAMQFFDCAAALSLHFDCPDPVWGIEPAMANFHGPGVVSALLDKANGFWTVMNCIRESQIASLAAFDHSRRQIDRGPKKSSLSFALTARQGPTCRLHFSSNGSAGRD